MVIIKGLRQNGVQVVECHAELWRDTADKIRAVKRGLFNLRLLRRALANYFRLLKRYAKVGDYDVMIVGYPGYFDLFLAKLLALFSGKPLVFDAFISLTETIVDDRSLARPRSLLGKLACLVDRYSCRLADLVILDTEAHIQYFCKDVGINPNKLRRVFAGADDIYHVPFLIEETNHFKVLYFGQFIPLHGANYIVEAAKILEAYPDIHFELVGRGQTYEEVTKLAKNLQVRNVTFHHRLPSAEALMTNYILPANVCLGIFGDTPKARRVVPTKVFVALSVGKPVITGDSPAAREVLAHKENTLLCEMGNPEAIAESILLLKNDADLRQRIAEEGYRVFQQRFCPKAIGAVVKDYLAELVARGEPSKGRGSEERSPTEGDTCP